MRPEGMLETCLYADDLPVVPAKDALPITSVPREFGGGRFHRIELVLRRLERNLLTEALEIDPLGTGHGSVRRSRSAIAGRRGVGLRTDDFLPTTGLASRHRIDLVGVMSSAPAPRFRVALLRTAIVLLLLSGCGVSEDNGTRLAYALEKAAKELRASNASEIVVHYTPIDGVGEPYYVELTPSLEESWQKQEVWSSYLVVSGQSSGGTSYHNRFVFVPKRLTIQKNGGATELVLKKEGDRISVVAVR